MTEQDRWSPPGYGWVPQSTDADLERICRPVFGDYTLPTMVAMVEELPELTAALFRIAVANIRKPQILVVGGIDTLHSIRNAHMLLERLVAPRWFCTRQWWSWHRFGSPFGWCWTSQETRGA